jgi:hypothetical protein
MKCLTLLLVCFATSRAHTMCTRKVVFLYQIEEAEAERQAGAT